MAVGYFKVTIPADSTRSGERCANGMRFGAAVHDDGHFEPFVRFDVKVGERGLSISQNDLDVIVRRICRIVVVSAEAKAEFLFRAALRRVGLRAPEPGVVSDGAEIVNAAAEQDGPLVTRDQLSTFQTPALGIDVLATAWGLREIEARPRDGLVAPCREVDVCQ